MNHDMHVSSLQLMHALSQPVVSSPCDQLHCSHLCLLAPAVRSRSGVLGSTGAPVVRGLTAVCRCPKGMVLSKDKITCSVPMESTFILLLSRTTVYQVNFLTLVSTINFRSRLLLESKIKFNTFLLFSLHCSFLLLLYIILVDSLALHVSRWCWFEKNAKQPSFSPSWSN